MAKGINIAIGADTRAYADAVKKGLIDPTEQAAEALEELGKSGPRDLDRIEDSMRDAQKATEKTRDEVDDLKDQLRDLGRGAKADFAKPMKDAADDTSKAFEQVKDDGFSNAKEVASSFDGSAQSIVDGFQGAAAEAFSGFGPAGAIAGLAAAAGLGLITAEFTKQQEAAEEAKQALVDMYTDAAAAGRAYLDSEMINDKARELAMGDRKKFEEQAKALGLDLNTVILAQAGSYEHVQVVIKAAEQAAADLASTSDAGSRQGLARLQEEQDAVGGVIREYAGLEEQHKRNQEGAQVAMAVAEELHQGEREQIKKTRDADQARYEAAARRYGVPLPAAVVPVTADTAAADRAMRAFASKTYRVKVDIEGRLQNGQRII